LIQNLPSGDILRPTQLLLRIFLVAALATVGASLASAQAPQPQAAQQPQANEQPSVADGPIEQAAKALEKAKQDLVALEDGVRQKGDDDDALVALAGKTDELGRSVLNISVGLRPRL